MPNPKPRRNPNVSPAELIELCPRLGLYATGRPSWPSVIDAADWTRHEYGISQWLWRRACKVLGRERAAIAIGIVTTKPADHFTASAGAYFHAMIDRATTGDLHLEKSIFGLRENPESRRMGMTPREVRAAARDPELFDATVRAVLDTDDDKLGGPDR